MPLYKIIDLIILVIGIILGIRGWQRASKVVKIATILLAVTLLVEVLATVSAKVFRNNLWVYHLFNPIHFYLVTRCFWLDLRMPVQKMLMYALPVTFIIISVTLQSNDFPSYAINLCFGLYILWALIYFKKLLGISTEEPFWHFPLFWISCGWLQFCALNLFQLGIFNFIITNTEEFKSYLSVLKNIRIGSNYLLYVCYILAIWFSAKDLKIDKK